MVVSISGSVLPQIVTGTIAAGRAFSNRTGSRVWLVPELYGSAQAAPRRGISGQVSECYQ